MPDYDPTTQPYDEPLRHVDEPPQRWVQCDFCWGEGTIPRGITVYERGCGFPHDDVVEDRCRECNGNGGWIAEVEADNDPTPVRAMRVTEPAKREPTADERQGMLWWNTLGKSHRAHWLHIAGSARPSDAWAAFKRAEPTKASMDSVISVYNDFVGGPLDFSDAVLRLIELGNTREEAEDLVNEWVDWLAGDEDEVLA